MKQFNHHNRYPLQWSVQLDYNTDEMRQHEPSQPGAKAIELLSKDFDSGAVHRMALGQGGVVNCQ